MIRSDHIQSVFDLEKHRIDRQIVFDSQTTRLERNQLGQFATPNKLAVEIATYVDSLLADDEEIRFLEPAIGSGSFYSAILQAVDTSRLRSAIGFEIDHRLANVSECLWGDLGLEVVNGDFTRHYLQVQDSNLVLANPPYVRHHHLDRLTKYRLHREVLDTCGLAISGLSGLYVYFMTLAHASMADDGIAAWLIPSEFMDVNYGSVLRQYLGCMVELIRIHRFDPEDVQFQDALVSSAVVVFRKSLPQANSKVSFTFGGTMLNPARTERVKVEALQGAYRWSSLNGRSPRAESSVKTRIGDLFTIKRGLVTGANSYFIMTRDRAHELGLPIEYLRPILPSPRYLYEDIVLKSECGYPLLDSQLVLLDCNLTKEEIQEEFPTLWAYIVAGVAEGINDRYLPSRRKPWYSQERRVPAPFLSTYMGRGTGDDKPFRFIWNHSEALATNVYLLLYPKPNVIRLIDTSERAALMHQGLNSFSADELRSEARVYGGGLYKLEPRELGRLSAGPLVERFPELAEVTDTDRANVTEKQLLLWCD